MKALVLSGGAGTRLRPFSHSVPKQLVPVAGKPVLFHILEMLARIGVTETGIVVSAAGTPIRSAVGDGSQFGMCVTYLPQEKPEGLAHCVKIARGFLGDDDFVMCLGDNVFSGGIAEPMEEFIRWRPAAQLVVTKVEKPSQYGIAELDEQGRVTALQEKPAHPRSDLAVTGTYFFTPAIHEAVASIVPSRRGELEITDAIQWLVTQGRPVRAQVYSGYWKDTGTLDDLLKCNQTLLEGVAYADHGTVCPASEILGPVLIEPGARVEHSMIVGPTVIGAGSVVTDSYVGPSTSVGRECVLTDVGIEYSIVLDGASIHGVRPIEGSIIGRAADVRRAPGTSVAHRLLVGDDSRVEVPA